MEWHEMDEDEVLRNLGSDKDRGLASAEASKRLKEKGPNRFFEPYNVTFLDILKEEIVEPMILLLLSVGVLYSIWGGIADAATIFVVIVVLVIVEVNNEYRAKRSIASLKQLTSPETSVLRDGKVASIKTDELVPGDVINVKTGDRVPADARIILSIGIETDESALTGESFPTRKSTGALAASTAMAERNNMLFSGTVITKGNGRAVVVATGPSSEIGRIGKAAKFTKDPKTPLQLEMKQLAKFLVWVALFFSILVPVLGLLRGGDPAQMVLTGLSMAFATIPEELPIIITMVLGLGALSLSRRHVLVKRLKAAETLGSVTVIATDKTGTLTENSMRLESIHSPMGKTATTFGPEETKLMETALLATGAIDQDARAIISPGPLAEAILKANANLVIEDQWRFVEELSFDNVRKMASYVYELSGGRFMYSSGAPEIVLARCNALWTGSKIVMMTENDRLDALRRAEEMAESGQRVIAVASKKLVGPLDRAEEKMIFTSLLGFYDPPRKEVKEAVDGCHRAGIKVIMITGDHPRTAMAVARAVGISSDRALTGNDLDGMDDASLKNSLKSVAVFARTTPEHKARLVRALKENGEIVAVTGDGINDAPALKEAHIGVAMGARSTDVAKEAADMVLTDDNFSTIKVAVGEGRKMFDNLSKGVRYYLACKMALVAAFLLPIALNVPLPFSPIQIIMLELFMDLGASAAFVVEKAEADVMTRPPRDPGQAFIGAEMKEAIFAGAASLFAAVTAAYLYVWYSGADQATAQTVAFTTWLLGHIFLAFNMRSLRQPLTRVGLGSNKAMLGWAAAAFLFLAIAVPLPFLHETLRLTSLNIGQWVLAITLAFICTFWLEARKLILQ